MSGLTHAQLAREIGEDLEAQRKQWEFRRIGITVVLLLILSAATGLIARGPLSGVHRTTPDGRLSVKYQRVLHYKDSWDAEITAQGTSDLLFSRELIRALEIHRIDPEPESSTNDERFVRYRFRPAASGTLRVVIHAQAEERGPIRGEIRLPDGDGVEIRGFNFP